MYVGNIIHKGSYSVNMHDTWLDNNTTFGHESEAHYRPNINEATKCYVNKNEYP